ncbi:hypothetical protein HOD08_03100 [bacterium]|nr:hypothetical protein [bacterium]
MMFFRRNKFFKCVCFLLSTIFIVQNNFAMVNGENDEGKPLAVGQTSYGAVQFRNPPEVGLPVASCSRGTLRDKLADFLCLCQRDPGDRDGIGNILADIRMHLNRLKSSARQRRLLPHWGDFVRLENIREERGGFQRFEQVDAEAVNEMIMFIRRESPELFEQIAEMYPDLQGDILLRNAIDHVQENYVPPGCCARGMQRGVAIIIIIIAVAAMVFSCFEIIDHKPHHQYHNTTLS